ncbi:hypothetical protein TRFO_33879 [Tritrichomonas foetus]|uniref:Uncharacterized protein n=1 Tax=Tritrichomonas foetus TaxID=1144522 RepID=A0A1J4JKG2_9EUKA|nr:hypothetical protein TRFO_33879 [Tritrichomonas foetus]|eukprot:OHS99618.1 hypothetical protein TRFO_33879 [Tritrichomonas foetus]
MSSLEVNLLLIEIHEKKDEILSKLKNESNKFTNLENNYNGTNGNNSPQNIPTKKKIPEKYFINFDDSVNSSNSTKDSFQTSEKSSSSKFDEELEMKLKQFSPLHSSDTPIKSDQMDTDDYLNYQPKFGSSTTFSTSNSKTKDSSNSIENTPPFDEKDKTEQQVARSIYYSPLPVIPSPTKTLTQSPTKPNGKSPEKQIHPNGKSPEKQIHPNGKSPEKQIHPNGKSPQKSPLKTQNEEIPKTPSPKKVEKEENQKTSSTTPSSCDEYKDIIEQLINNESNNSTSATERNFNQILNSGRNTTPSVIMESNQNQLDNTPLSNGSFSLSDNKINPSKTTKSTVHPDTKDTKYDKVNDEIDDTDDENEDTLSEVAPFKQSNDSSSDNSLPGIISPFPFPHEAQTSLIKESTEIDDSPSGDSYSEKMDSLTRPNEDNKKNQIKISSQIAELHETLKHAKEANESMSNALASLKGQMSRSTINSQSSLFVNTPFKPANDSIIRNLPNEEIVSQNKQLKSEIDAKNEQIKKLEQKISELAKTYQETREINNSMSEQLVLLNSSKDTHLNSINTLSVEGKVNFLLQERGKLLAENKKIASEAEKSEAKLKEVIKYSDMLQQQIKKLHLDIKNGNIDSQIINNDLIVKLRKENDELNIENLKTNDENLAMKGKMVTLKNENLEMKMKNDQLSSENQQLQKQVSQLLEEKKIFMIETNTPEERDKILFNYKSRYIKYQDQNQKLEKELGLLKSEVKQIPDLKAQLANKTQYNEKLISTLKIIKEKFETIKGEKVELHKKIREYEDIEKQLNQRTASEISLKNEIKLLQKKNLTLETEKANQIKDSAESQAKNIALFGKYRTMENRLFTLEEENKELIATIEDLRRNVQKLSHANTALSATIGDVNSSDDKLQAAFQKMNELQQKNEELSMSIEFIQNDPDGNRYQEEIKEKRTKIVDLLKLLDEAKDQNSEMENKNIQLTSKISELCDDITDLRNQVADLTDIKAHHDEMIEKNKKLVKELMSLKEIKDNYAVLQYEKTKLMNVISEINEGQTVDKAIESIKKLKNDKSAQEDKVRKLTNEKDKLVTEKEKLLNELDEIKKKNKKIEDEMMKMKKSLKASTSKPNSSSTTQYNSKLDSPSSQKSSKLNSPSKTEASKEERMKSQEILEGNNKTITNENIKLTSKIAELEGKQSILEKENQELKEKILEFESLQNIKNNTDDIEKIVSEKISQYTKKISDLENQCKEYDERFEKFEKQEKNGEKIIEEFESKEKCLKDENRQLKEKVNQLMEEYTESQKTHAKKLQELSSKIEKVKTKNSDYQNSIKAEQGKCKQLQEELEEAVTKAKKVDKLMEKVSRLKDEINKLNEENLNNKVQNTQKSEQEQKNMADKVNKLKNKCSLVVKELKDKIESLESSNSSLDDQLKASAKKIASLSAELNAAQHKSSKVTKELQIERKQHAEIESSFNVMKTSFKVMQKRIDETDKEIVEYKVQLKKFQNDLQKKKENCETSNTELSKTKALNHSLDQRNKELVKENVQNKSDINKLIATLAKNENEIHQSLTYKNQIEEMEVENKKLANENLKVKADNEKLATLSKKLQDYIKESNLTSFIDLKEENSKLQKQIEEINADKYVIQQNMQTKVDEMTEAQIIIDNLKQEVETLRNTANHYKTIYITQIDQLNSQNSALIFEKDDALQKNKREEMRASNAIKDCEILRSENTFLKQKIADDETEKKNLLTKLNEQENECYTKVEILRSEKKQLETSVNKLKRELENQVEEFTNLAKEKKQLESILKKINKEKMRSKSPPKRSPSPQAKDSKKMDGFDFQKENDELKWKFENLLSEYEEVKEKLSKAKSKNEKILKENQQVKEENMTFKSNEQIAEEKIKDMKNQIETKNSELERLRNLQIEIERIKTEINVNETLNNEMLNENPQNNNINNNQTNSNNNENSNNNSNDNRKINSSISSFITAIQIDNTKLRNEINSMKTNELKLTQKIKSLKDKKRILHKEIESLNQKMKSNDQEKDKKIDKLKTKNNRLYDDLEKQLKFAEQAKEKLESDIKSLQNELDIKLSKFETIKNENTKLSTSISALEAHIRSLENDLHSSKMNNHKLSEELLSLKKFKSQQTAIDKSYIAQQNKNLTAVFQTHFRLIIQNINLFVSKQLSQFSSQILGLTTRVTYLQNRLKYHPKYPVRLLQSQISNVSIQKEIYRGLRTLQVTPPPNLSLQNLVNLLVDSIKPIPILRFQRKIGEIVLPPNEEIIPAKTVFQNLANSLNVSVEEENSETAIALLKKANRTIEHNAEKHDDAVHVLNTIRNFMQTANDRECIAMLHKIFKDV